MILDIAPFARSIERLREGLARYRLDIADTQIRDGLIQRFEFTYELSHRTLKRYLQAIAANPGEYDEVAFQDLIRAGNVQGLLRGDWPAWRTYRAMRGKTSHTYDEEVAMQVVAEIPAFLEEAQWLLDQLRGRLA